MLLNWQIYYLIGTVDIDTFIQTHTGFLGCENILQIIKYKFSCPAIFVAGKLWHSIISKCLYNKFQKLPKKKKKLKLRIE